jgi:hypothetical protein
VAASYSLRPPKKRANCYVLSKRSKPKLEFRYLAMPMEIAQNLCAMPAMRILRRQVTLRSD